MNLGAIRNALRDEGQIPLRAIIERFDGRNPDGLGPPGRLPLFLELLSDMRFELVTDQRVWLVRLRP